MKYKSLALIPVTGVSHNREIRKKVLIANGEIPHITQLSRVILKPGQIAAIHKHSDMYEIFNIESGKGKILVDNNEFKLTVGVCIIVEPGEEHEVQNTDQDDLTITITGIRV